MKWSRQLAMVVALLVCAHAHADQQEGATELHKKNKPRPSLLSIETEAGGGLSIGAGSAGPTVLRAAPMTLSLVADYAIISQPWVSVFGGLRGEVVNRAGVGAVVGLRIRPTRSPFR